MRADRPSSSLRKRGCATKSGRRCRFRGSPGFPRPDNRIPNFVGAEAAAAASAATEEWEAARTVKSNPDSPQLPVRVRALEDGKLLYMAVPRLAGADPFFVLDPAAAGRSAAPGGHDQARSAGRRARSPSTRWSPSTSSSPGCVAVGDDGARLGKGGGFSDLEFALAAAAGLVDEHTVVVTTVHDVQVRARREIPTTAHDVHVDLVVTPTRVLRCPRPKGYRLPQLRVVGADRREDRGHSVARSAHAARAALGSGRCPTCAHARYRRPGRRRSSRRTRPRCCAATPPSPATASRSGSTTGCGPTASTSPSRAGWPTSSLDRLPAGGPRHVAVLLDNMPEYLFAFGGAALLGAAVVGLNHTRRGEHLLRDVEHTDCGLVITEPRHEALLAPIADELPPVLVVDRFADADDPPRRSARRSPTRSPTPTRPIPASSPTSTRSGRSSSRRARRTRRRRSSARSGACSSPATAWR